MGSEFIRATCGEPVPNRSIFLASGDSLAGARALFPAHRARERQKVFETCCSSLRQPVIHIHKVRWTCNAEYLESMLLATDDDTPKCWLGRQRDVMEMALNVALRGQVNSIS